jgi:hypothetical protein
MADLSVIPLTPSVNPHNESWLLNLSQRIKVAWEQVSSLTDDSSSTVALAIGCAGTTGPRRDDHQRGDHCCFRAAERDCGRGLGALARQETKVKQPPRYVREIHITANKEKICDRNRQLTATILWIMSAPTSEGVRGMGTKIGAGLS